jgi:hypothetical protein
VTVHSRALSVAIGVMSKNVTTFVSTSLTGWINLGDDVKPFLQLTGEDGNAFSIMGRARRAARRAGWSKEKITEYTGKCMSGDYDHLLQVTMEYFDVH